VDAMKANTDQQKVLKLLRKLRKRNRELLRTGRVKQVKLTARIDFVWQRNQDGDHRNTHE
jgi:hypothetical protein